MALIVCKDCTKEFSTDALRCPNCGARRPASRTTKRFWKTWGMLVVGVFIWAQIDMALQSPEEKAQREQKKILHAAGYACQYHTKNTLNDPDSAVFDDPIVSPSTVLGNKPLVNRFEVVISLHARNSYGAMVKGTAFCTVEMTGANYVVTTYYQL